MPSLRNFTIAQRLVTLTALCLVGIAVLVTVLLRTERALILQERERGVQQAVESAASMVAHFHAQAQAGKLSDEAARQAAMQSVKAMRYGGSEYFWINDLHPTMVMHPIKPELDGRDLSANQDPSGKHLFVEFAQVVKTSGSGFVWYLWPKPGSDTPVQKVSYVQGFAPWGWVIGSGVYVDSVDASIASRFANAAWGTAALALVLLATGTVITRSVVSQLGGEPAHAVDLTRQMAEGNLAVAIAVQSADQTSLLHAMLSMRDSFARIVGAVREGSLGVAQASAEITRGSSNLSGRTEHQASAVEETAASMQELSSTVQRNVESLRQANALAMNASAVAGRGGAAVGEVMGTMQGINESSHRISDIIGVIDGIAFQTNILALNAAVEAARAGEQGRGFAVVATEVRSLAGRSATAAREIKELISASVQRVELGSAQANRAGSTMQEVVDAIQQVTQIISEMDTASSEQATGVSQVGQAMATLDQATQQNAALVEEMAAAATQLQELADALVQTVSVFRLQA